MLNKNSTNKALIQHHIIVKPSTIHGYGVFATKDIPINTVIEECYCIFSDYRDPRFKMYYFTLGKTVILPAGFGFIYNHAPTPNAVYCFDEAKKLMTITSKKHIRANEEIFISYGKDWFLERKISVKRVSLLQRLLSYLNDTPIRAIIALSGLLIAIYLMNVLTGTQRTQKTLESLSMTTLQEKDI